MYYIKIKHFSTLQCMNPPTKQRQINKDDIITTPRQRFNVLIVIFQQIQQIVLQLTNITSILIQFSLGSIIFKETMKILCIALLLVLSLQLRLTTHQNDDVPPQPPADDPLFGLTFFVQDPSNEEENVGQVLFTDQVHFVGCNSNWAGYTINNDGSFHVDSQWASTRMACEGDKDQEIIGLFEASTKFQLVNNQGIQVTLFNEAGEKTLVLTWPEEIQPDEPEEEHSVEASPHA